MYLKGVDILCTEKCPCNVDPGVFSTEMADQMVTDTMGATRLEECPFDSTVVNSAQKEKYYPILEILETDFQCSGMCSDIPYYLFSDVRNGVPVNGNCKHEIIQFVEENAAFYAVVLLLIGIVGFLGMTMAVSIYYLRKKNYQGKAFYNPSKWGAQSKND